jgi:iron(III) transport system substrate-binding protein
MYFTTIGRRFAFGIIAAAALLPLNAAQAEESVNVYSYRQPALIEPLIKAYSEQTGIKVNLIFAEKGLIERMVQEGANSPADVLLTADVGRLVEAQAKGLSQPVRDEIISKNVPETFSGPDGHWYGLTMRARVAYASRDRVDQDRISYEELADPKWKGKICIRPGQHPYNLGLIAAMIARRGEAKTKQWLTGLKDNLAVRPSGNDRSQAKSVHAGECDIAIANTYYMGKMLTNTEEPEQQDWAKSVRILFPNSAEMGTHVNISGMLMAKHAPHRENALKLMRFLSEPEAQKLYAEGNFEYPVNPMVKPSEIVASWGKFTPDSLPLGEIARNEKRASELVDEVGFDN